MKTKNLLTLLLHSFCTFVLISCSDKEDLSGHPDTPSANDTYISPSIPHGRITIEASPSHTRPFLGAGYDIMGDYLGNSSLKEPVLDLSKIDSELITRMSGSSGEGDNFSGCNVEEFLQSFTKYKEFVVPAENKDDLLFTTTITDKERFTEPYDYSSQYTFVFKSSGAKMIIERLLTLNPKWASWLSDDFRQDLEEMLPESLINQYGTHVLVTTRLGYTVKTLYRSVVADDEKNLLRTAITGMGARENTIVKFPNVTITYPEETVKKNYGGAIVVSFQGGDCKSLPHIQLTPEGVVGDPVNIGPWMKTSNENTYALATLTGKDLIPIYDIITDPEKKQQIKQAVTAHIKAHQLSLQQMVPIFQATDGKSYRYYTSYKKLAEKTESCQGVIASVFVHSEPGTVPLYLSSAKESDRLSLDPQEGRATIIGYVYAEPAYGFTRIYEISNGKGFAYTTEAKEFYGEQGTWKQTGKFFYTKKV